MKKYALLALFLPFLFSKVAYAQDFKFQGKSTYEFTQSGQAEVEQEITITNNTKFMYPPTYTTHLDMKNVEEMVVTDPEGKSIPFTTSDTDDGEKIIKAVFEGRNVGVGKTTSLVVKYKTRDLVTQLGNTREVYIPGVKKIDEFASYTSTVTVPASWGDASITKPEGIKKRDDKYLLTKETLSENGALLIFGDAEYYKVELEYDLANQNFFPLRTEIALPPETPYQEVIYQKIDPKPQKIVIDRDGNYMGQYQLEPQQKVTVKATILVKLLATPLRQEVLTTADRKEYQSARKYWDTGSWEIRKNAQELKNPQGVFKFLTQGFTYSHAKAQSGDTRLGAAKAIKDRANVVCLEFTDLFVTLTRVIKVPARSVEGYAYTSDQSTKPLSFPGDVLHAWPEYYNQEKKQWVMIDPTWGNTTGLDYFTSLDLAHITFVKKGHDTEYPIPPGAYKSTNDKKQITVSFIDSGEFTKNEKLTLSVENGRATIPRFEPVAEITVTNTGNAPIIGKKLTIAETGGAEKEMYLGEIPPLGDTKITFPLKGSILTPSKHKITMQVGEMKAEKELTIGLEQKQLIFWGGGVALGIVILACSFKAGSLLIQRRRG